MAQQPNPGGHPQWPFRYHHRQNHGFMPVVFYTFCVHTIVDPKALAASTSVLGEDVAENGAAEF